ncbi:MAG: GlsB/YeaQ/YmgE family stress response membrane protein [Ignavibacteriae bacterium]|nr:MAG: GlsB/YeaQ/YmgE family stress response membrane protein [Ignavibacteriota bacterium]
MNLLSWILVGGIAGWLSTKIIKPQKPKGCFTGILLGIIGAVVGGLIISFLGGKGVTGFNVYSIFVATFGAVVLIWLGKKLNR